MMEGAGRALSGASSSKPVAWVTLVLGLDLSYVAAASVLASSLKRLGTKGECVCMVTPDVPKSARTLLKGVFDRVEEVPYLETLALQKYSERFDSMYNYWLDKSFTKCAMFALVEYEKVIFLDADMLPLENPDELFNCTAPAGICSSVKEATENDRLHGMPLPRLLIEESLKNGQGHYGVRGCLLIMKPDLEVYRQIRSKVENVTHLGSLDSMVGPDEYLITQHFCDQWHHVHAKYGWVSWADRQDLGVDPCFLHYVSQKPWDEGEPWEDFDYWKKEAKELLQHFPQTITYFSHLTETMAQMAGVELTEEMKAVSKGFMESAKRKKTEEKLRREARAQEFGIDLTLSTGPRANSWWKGTHVSSPRSARPATVPKIPHSLTPLPNSARSSGEKPETTVTKVTTNVLVIKGHKRPEKPKKEAKSKNQNKNKQTTKSSVLVKPTVPKLNLEGVQKEEATKSGWNGNHWKKKTGESKADVDNWRTPSARRATPERLVEELRPMSARNWPNTPTSGCISGRKGAPYMPKRAQTPKSSRADLATSWRSTPRRESGNNQRGTYGNFQDRCPDRDFFRRGIETDSVGTAANEDPARSKKAVQYSHF